MHPFSQSRHQARAFSLADLFWIIFILALLISILLPSLSRSRELAKRAVCASNLRGMGQGLHIYANDNAEWLPIHYFTPPKHLGPNRTANVSWVGTMGSNDFLRISQATSPETSPDKNHPSRSLFLLMIGGLSTAGTFNCPSSNDREDDMRNYGPDANDGSTQTAARPGRNRFDFAGYDRLSYGYQLPYGRKGRPRENMDSRTAIAADKSPYYASGGPGLAGTRTTRDRRSRTDPPADWAILPPMDIQRTSNEEWREFNSRNHKSEGQIVLYIDSHVDFQPKPIAGVNSDNLYTIQSGYTTADGMIGRVPDADQSLGPLTSTDSFLVP